MQHDRGESTNGARSILSRLSRLAHEEVAKLYPRIVIAEVASRALPQHTFNFTRTMFMRAAGFKIGSRTRFFGPVRITGQGDCPELLSIGEGCMISGPLHIDLGGSVRIGDRVHIGHHVVLLTVNHAIGPSAERCAEHCVAPIVIEDGAWIGSCVTILPGVRVAAGAVIAAGAVVARDVMPDTVVGGVPAKTIRDYPGPDSGAPPRSR